MSTYDTFLDIQQAARDAAYLALEDATEAEFQERETMVRKVMATGRMSEAGALSTLADAGWDLKVAIEGAQWLKGYRRGLIAARVKAHYTL